MEGRKELGSSSSSSFTSDLFGSKDSSASSSSGIFGSIFAPSSQVVGRESVRSGLVEKKQDSASQVWNDKLGPPVTNRNSSEGEGQSTPNRDMNFYQEEKVQPCHLSSSIYYGGQDIYSYPKSSQSSGLTTFNKEGGEDDSGSASRGNWWKGSLYY
ncbi:uncharacterized protein LOC132313207 [Cornus florida]|uniref:uncharacterized protein LOC132313207 n=1 Tax=Cornus florida TaxID=4283 RepID=UPI00289B7E4B|nr:uncharacterized protein LOC132313207 [Cornus florida]